MEFVVHIHFEGVFTYENTKDIHLMDEYAYFNEKMGGENEAIKWIIYTILCVNSDITPFGKNMCHADIPPIMSIDSRAIYKAGDPRSIPDVFRWAIHNRFTLNEFVCKLNEYWSYHRLNNYITVVDLKHTHYIEDDLFKVTLHNVDKKYKIDTIEYTDI